MVVHIFTAERYHLVPSISKGFITTYKSDAHHRFVLCCSNSTNISFYKTLYEEQSFTDYIFCFTIFQFARALWHNRNNCILFHAGSYYQFLLSFILGCRNVNWICWGSGASISNGRLSGLSSLFKRLIYKKFRTIVTLMDDDRKSIIQDFHVREEQVSTIPYASGGDSNPRDAICLRLLKQEENTECDKPLVLLGNNPSNVKYYIRLLHELSPFRGKIRVQCMMNYSVEHNDLYTEFIQCGRELFGDDFQSNEDFYDGAEAYVNYMNTCDIYICGNPNQSGLGAVNTTLALGKKVYLTGKNYNWAKDHFGAIVFDVKDIADFDSFVQPLTLEEKLFNYQKIVSQRVENAMLWRSYLARIDALSIQE